MDLLHTHTQCCFWSRPLHWCATLWPSNGRVCIVLGNIHFFLFCSLWSKMMMLLHTYLVHCLRKTQFSPQNQRQQFADSLTSLINSMEILTSHICVFLLVWNKSQVCWSFLCLFLCLYFRFCLSEVRKLAYILTSSQRINISSVPVH